jgi:transcriptional regulator with XRE-family HTH domain
MDFAKRSETMVFSEKLKTERNKQGWTQDELALKLFVSRQSVSKWENGQNYPSIEIIMKISDLFGVTIDELLRSDEELANNVIKESRQLAYPKLKYAADVIFLVGVLFMGIKLVVLLLNKTTPLDMTLPGGSLWWNFGPLATMVLAGIVSGVLKEKYKQE